MENNKHNLEIEYKFLVDIDKFFDTFFTKDKTKMLSGVKTFDFITQAYLSTDPSNTIRIRSVMSYENKDGGDINSFGVITRKQKIVKSEDLDKTAPLANIEDEVTIPYSDAREAIKVFIKNPKEMIAKNRYKVEANDGNIWEVDEFLLANEGLYLAELEVPSADYSFEKPDWVLDDVSSDRRYTNASLTLNPFCNW